MYLDGPNRLEERKVLIFDKLTDIEGYMLVSCAPALRVSEVTLDKKHVRTASR
jgi:hypothetical protein